MKKNSKILLLSVAALLVMVILVVVIRRRGRKVYISEDFAPDTGQMVVLYQKDFSNKNALYFQNVLKYVVLPYDYEKKAISDGTVTYYPVKATGEVQTNNQVAKVNLKEYAYINPAYLDL
jgi:hypothetical protein